MTEHHLNCEEVAAVAAGTADARCAGHALGCAECSAAVQRLRTTLDLLAVSLRQDSQRTDAEWARQRSQIASAAAARDRQSGVWRWAMASAALAAVALGLMIASPSVHFQPARQQAPPAATMSTDQLFATISDELDRDSPAALDPAALLLEERNRILSSSAAPHPGRPQGEQND